MNPLLQKTESEVMAKINPAQLRPVVKKLVDAGKKIMYADKTRHLIIKELNQPGEETEIVGASVAKLAGLVMTQVKGTVPMQAMVPALMLLLCEGLDFMEKAGKAKVTPEFLAACTKATTSSFLQLLGVTPDRLAALFDHAKGGQPAAIPPSTAQSPAPKGIIGTAQGAM